ncbi:fibroblast growth factor 20-like [Acropora millepora]|uniref:fibroblast growth factor 20-like n=1 Tax=Acropora millepora TaxID=45264 RepID=UPI001CF4B888|nr:fibroblast growth factor 20-like [Acropora millepora]
MVFRLQSTTLLPRRRKLQCRNGYFLEVRPDGTVRGTKNNNSIYTVFHLSTVGSNTSTLWAEEAGLYLGIDNRGNIVTTATKIPACMLRETLDTEFFNSFCMEFSPRRLHCLAISAQGKVRSSILTSSRNVQFITKLIC